MCGTRVAEPSRGRPVESGAGEKRGVAMVFECGYRAGCEFYRGLSTKLGVAMFFVTHYCHGPGFPRCARHICYSQLRQVPADLYPTQTWRLRSIAAGEGEALVGA